MTSEEYFNAYRQYLSGLSSMRKSAHTIETYSIALRKFECYLNSVEQKHELSPIDIANFRTALYSTGIKSNTVKQYLIALHTFFESSIRMKLTTENPVHMEELPKAEQIEYDLLSLEEIKQTLNSTKPPKGMTKELYIRNRAIIVLFLQTGLRNSELRTLRLCDLDLKKCTIIVKHGKGDKQRIVALPTLSRDAIQEYLNSGIRPKHLSEYDFLFGSDCDKTGHRTHGKEWHPLSSYALLLMIRHYIEGTTGKKNGVKVHALRHAYASIVAELGVPMRTVQLSLGHQNLTTTERVYTKILSRTAVASTINTALDNWGK